MHIKKQRRREERERERREREERERANGRVEKKKKKTPRGKEEIKKFLSFVLSALAFFFLSPARRFWAPPLLKSIAHSWDSCLPICFFKIEIITGLFFVGGEQEGGGGMKR